MKKLIFTAVILFSCLSFKFADAQVHVSFGVNIGVQPEWGPVGYDHADYYYMPDIDAYYDVPAHQYVYYSNHAWIRSGGLPPRYANYDVYHGYKVVVNEPTPWIHHDQIRARYAQYRGRHDQVVIRDSHDSRYQNHWHGDNGHDPYHDHGHADNGHGDHGHDDHGHDDHHNGY